ncbi:hypothetical protein SAMN05443252_104238 [Bacillus sp. OV322]|uniref:hypothetical protein n=1 Tax=Bacillus sp. OV322 TaxID=1882764 RepID=UPI0008DF9705|nr:hypothetical protein [Bacillus sp. OV322]SFC54719.1 hypothetical protein SAMN05443252_104238 [Bacillus sp. OV322]
MKNYFQNQKGYALVIVLLFIAVVAIGTVTMYSYSVNSQKFINTSSASVQDKLRAERIMDEAIMKVQTGLEAINPTLTNASPIIDKITALINNVNASSGGKYNIVQTVTEDGQREGVYNVNATFTVYVNKNGKKLVKTVALSTIKDIFQYSAVSNSDFKLNGSAYLQGDVFTNGNLYSLNYGKFLYGKYSYAPTSFPAIDGKLTVKGSINGGTMNGLNPIWTPVPKNTQNLQSIFSLAPVIKDRNTSFTPIAVSSIIVQKSAYPANGNNFPYYGNTSSWFYNYPVTYNTSETIRGNARYNPLVIGNNGNLTINGDLIVNGSLTITGNGKLTVNGNIYVSENATLSGTLNLAQNKYIYINKKATIESFTLNGQMYVGQNVDIQEDFNTNGTLYAKTGIEVTNLSNNSGGTLVLICDGMIKVSNNNQFEDNPKEINAYFYSNSSLEIYGVGSNLKINGGVYGNPVELNAMKGKTSTSQFKNSFENGGLWFENNQLGLEPSKSRLSIIFKNEMIYNPPNGIPTVEKISMKEIEKHYTK